MNPEVFLPKLESSQRGHRRVPFEHGDLASGKNFNAWRVIGSVCGLDIATTIRISDLRTPSATRSANVLVVCIARLTHLVGVWVLTDLAQAVLSIFWSMFPGGSATVAVSVCELAPALCWIMRPELSA